MSLGESSALVIVGALMRFALAWPPRYVSVRPVGLIYINFHEAGLIVMIGGAVSLALWIALAPGRRRAIPREHGRCRGGRKRYGDP